MLSNKRYFLKFDGNQRMISDIDSNPATGKKYIVNIFILYHLNAYDANNCWTRKGLFGHNGQFDKFVSFLPPPNKDLLVPRSGNYTLIGPSFSHSKNIGSHKTKADCNKSNEWFF